MQDLRVQISAWQESRVPSQCAPCWSQEERRWLAASTLCGHSNNCHHVSGSALSILQAFFFPIRLILQVVFMK